MDRRPARPERRALNRTDGVGVRVVAFAGCLTALVGGLAGCNATTTEDLARPRAPDAAVRDPDDTGAPDARAPRDAGPRRDATGHADAAPPADAAPDAALAWEPRTTCPAADGLTSANTFVRATFPLAIAPVPVGGVPLRLACDGLEIPGTSERVGDLDLLFTPTSPLTIGARCVATVQPGVRDAVIGLELTGAWSFVVDGELRGALRFDALQPLVRDVAIPAPIPVAGQDVVVSLVSPRGMAAARSRDEGRSWVIAQPQPDPPGGTGQDALAADDAVVHAVWRSRGGAPEERLAYARWPLGAAGFEPGTWLDEGDPNVSVGTPAIATAPGGVVIALWAQFCVASSLPCPDAVGLYARTSSDSGQTFGAPRRVASAPATEPRLVQTGTQALALWIDADGHLLVTDARADFAPRGRGPALAPPFRARATATGDILVEREGTWSTWTTAGAPVVPWQSYHDRSRLLWNAIDVAPSGEVWMLDVFAQQRRPDVFLRRSDDGGLRFGGALPMEPPPAADVCTIDARLSVRADEAVILAWRGVLARGRVMGPCGVDPL